MGAFFNVLLDVIVNVLVVIIATFTAIKVYISFKDKRYFTMAFESVILIAYIAILGILIFH